MKYLPKLFLLLVGLIILSCTKKVETTARTGEFIETPIEDTPESIAKAKAYADADAKVKSDADYEKAKEASRKEEGRATYGSGGAEFEEIGKLKRDVVEYASLSNLSKSDSVTFNICLTREGTITYVKYNRSKSSLTDRAAVSDALTVMKTTTFYSDPSAPVKECGQYTINYTMNESDNSMTSTEEDKFISAPRNAAVRKKSAEAKRKAEAKKAAYAAAKRKAMEAKKKAAKNALEIMSRDTTDYCREGPGANFDGKGELQRDVAIRAFPKDLNKSGKVVFNICVNREGNVVYAKYNHSKSTLSDRPSVSDALTAMKKTTFKRDSSAPSKECGQWTIKFTALGN